MKKVVGFIAVILIVTSSCRRVEKYQPPKPHGEMSVLIAPDSSEIAQEIIEEM